MAGPQSPDNLKLPPFVKRPVNRNAAVGVEVSAKHHQRFAIRFRAGSRVTPAKCLAGRLERNCHGRDRRKELSKANRRDAMSEPMRESFEIPKEMRSMAEAGFEQARRTFEKFLENAQ